VKILPDLVSGMVAVMEHGINRFCLVLTIGFCFEICLLKLKKAAEICFFFSCCLLAVVVVHKCQFKCITLGFFYSYTTEGLFKEFTLQTPTAVRGDFIDFREFVHITRRIVDEIAFVVKNLCMAYGRRT
jgi:hypothetical protein